MTSLFISYSRKDVEYARKLTEAFKSQDLDFWIDWEGIPPTVDWWREIEKGIEEAGVFVFLISPDSSNSKVCKREIEHAVKNGKRLIPLVIRDVSADQAPAELGALNWIFLRPTDDFGSSFDRLMTAIKTDYVWVQEHRQLQLKALEWERSQHDASFLLRGTELQTAETQLASNSSREPYPTDLQRDYVLKSRQATDKQRKTITSVAFAGVILLAALAVFGFIQAGLARDAQAIAESNLSVAKTAQVDAENKENARATAQAQAEERARIARAGELVAQAEIVRGTQLDLASLLGVEAFDTWDYLRTRSLLANDLNTNPQLQQYEFEHTAWVAAVAYSPTTNMLASAGCASNCENGELILWNVKNGYLDKITSITENLSEISSLAFNPDGSLLATGGCSKFDQGSCTQGQITLWDMKTYQPIGKPITAYSDTIQTLAFSPDGTFLVSGGCGAYDLSACTVGELRLWEVQDQSQIGDPIRGHTSWITDMAFSPDGQAFASSNADGTIMLWDVRSAQEWKPRLTINAGLEIIISLDFSPDGKTLVSGGTDDQLRLWDTLSGTPVREYTGHENDVYAVAFSPDGTLLASGSSDGSIKVWDRESAKVVATLRAHSGIVTSLAFVSKGNYLVSTNQDSRLILWNVKDSTPLGHPIQTGQYSLLNAFFDASGNVLTTEFKDGTVFVHDVDGKLKIKSSVQELPESFDSLALSSDRTMLALGGEGATYVRDLETGKKVFAEDLTVPEDSNWITALAFSHDNKMLASGGCKNRDESGVCRSGMITLWDMQDGAIIGGPIIAHANWVDALAFNSDDTLLASGSTDDSILLWDVTTRKIIGIPFLGHTAKVTSVVFSPDGKMLASGGEDGRIILWDLATHQPIVTFGDNRSIIISSVAFSPDARQLVSTDSGGTTTIWDVSPIQWKQSTCQRAGRNFSQAEWALYFPGEAYRLTCPQWPAGK
jgi:WD40 repeat protein